MWGEGLILKLRLAPATWPLLVPDPLPCQVELFQPTPVAPPLQKPTLSPYYGKVRSRPELSGPNAVLMS